MRPKKSLPWITALVLVLVLAGVPTAFAADRIADSEQNRNDRNAEIQVSQGIGSWFAQTLDFLVGLITLDPTTCTDPSGVCTDATASDQGGTESSSSDNGPGLDPNG